MKPVRVHICPVGYEFDRIVLAARSLGAERVWLVIEKNTAEENATRFIRNAREEMERGGTEVREKPLSRNDLFDNMNGVREIFMEEKGNQIYVNVSSGSKIQAIAGTMACMIFKEYEATPYYVVPDKYGSLPEEPQSHGVKEVVRIPRYTIPRPDLKEIKVMEILKSRRDAPEGWLSKGKLVSIMVERGLIESKGDKSGKSGYNKINKVIKSLSDEWGYVSVEKVGLKHRIMLTEEGKDACKFLI